MRARGALIHLSRTNSSIGVPLRHDLIDLRLVCDRKLCHVLNIDALASLFADFQILVAGVHEVTHPFHINLDVRDFDLESLRRWCLFDLSEYMTDHPWGHAPLLFVNDIGSQHCMRLATACLSIGEHCSIKAVHDTLNDRLHRLLIHLTLRAGSIKHAIIVELIRTAVTR